MSLPSAADTGLTKTVVKIIIKNNISGKIKNFQDSDLFISISLPLINIDIYLKKDFGNISNNISIKDQPYLVM
ncbi:MAG: hypothetical protein Kow0019_12070 [Methanobacteriaceae archaeon]